ncbi:MAG TPA: hypothetical protein VGF36_07815 [Rhodopila sp.]
MAGFVPDVFAPTDEARMAGTRPAMTDGLELVWPNNDPSIADTL